MSLYLRSLDTQAKPRPKDELTVAPEVRRHPVNVSLAEAAMSRDLIWRPVVFLRTVIRQPC